MQGTISWLLSWFRLLNDRLFPRYGTCWACLITVHFIPYLAGDTVNGKVLSFTDKRIHWLCPYCLKERGYTL